MKPWLQQFALWALAAAATAGEEVRVASADALREALRTAHAGTRILVAPGEYRGYFGAANLHGTAERPIVVAAADPANPPVFHGGNGCIHLSSVSFLILRNLTLAGARMNGLNVDDGGTLTTPSHHVILDGLTVRDIGPRGNCDGIKLSGIDDFLVRRCTVERWGMGGSGIDMVGCHRGIFAECTLRHTDMASSGIQAKGGSSDVLVYRCRFANAGQRAINMGGSTGLRYFRPPDAGCEAKRIAAIGNTFIGSMAPVAFVGSDECLAAFNTVYRPTGYLLRILQETRGERFVPSRNGVFRRNLVVWQSRGLREAVNVGPHTAPETFRFEGNWWYCEDRPSQSQPPLPTPDQTAVAGEDPGTRVDGLGVRTERVVYHGAGSRLAAEEFARLGPKLAPWAFEELRKQTAPTKESKEYGMQDLRYQTKRRTREELLKHLQTFELDLKFTVGIWYFSPGGGRFHARYVPDTSIEQRLELAAGWAKWGVCGIEAHYPLEANEGNLHLYKKLEQQAGIRLTNVGPFIFYDPAFEFGSLSNPLKASRQKAFDTLVANLKFDQKAGCIHCGIWPGIDGYTYPLGTVFYEMWDRFEETVAAAMDEVPGVRVAIEPKPYEPAHNNILRTTADGLLACHDIEARLKHPENRRLLAEGHAMVAMQPEIGHVCMGFEDVPYAFARCAREGRLGNTHWNSQPLGNYDQDLNVGVVGWEQTEALLYALKMIGYQGYFCFDINPERMPVEKAVEINCRVLRIMNDRINRLPHERILDCYFEPDKHRGELELILAEARK